MAAASDATLLTDCMPPSAIGNALYRDQHEGAICGQTTDLRRTGERRGNALTVANPSATATTSPGCTVSAPMMRATATSAGRENRSAAGPCCNTRPLSMTIR